MIFKSAGSDYALLLLLLLYESAYILNFSVHKRLAQVILQCFTAHVVFILDLYSIQIL